MIALNCPSCKKKLSVKDELAGKKVKCPGCGSVAAVPQLAESLVSPLPTKPNSAAPAADDERTLAPKSQAGQDSLDDSGMQTDHDGNRKGEPTQSIPTNEASPDLYDFLAPAEKADEIGRLGPYRVLKVLGAGGMGVVFRAEDPHLERMVALKAMLPGLAKNPASKERFFREAKAAAGLKHPHIVTIHQVGEDRGAPFLAMEFLEGEPLDERLKREPILPVPEILRIGREIAEGLAAAHKKGLIHRDIKPANIWLESSGEGGVANTSGEGRGASGEKRQTDPTSLATRHSPLATHVKILDFGLARAMGDTTHLTQSGAIVGTPAYMAPEQAGGKQVDHRCDLFSLGCVLYRMCTGERPFQGEDTISILSALALEEPPPPVSLNLEIPTELSDLVMQLLAKKPAGRPESAQVVVEALREIAEQNSDKTALAKPKTKKTTDGDTRTVALQAPPKKTAKRRLPLSWLVGGGVLVLVGLALFLLLRPGRNQSGLGTGPLEKIDLETKRLEKEISNSLGMKLVLIPAGKFMMGSSQKFEGPEHEVEITQPFYLGTTEVTVGQFRHFVNEKNYQVADDRWRKPGFEQTDDHPVVFVTWQNAVDFCAWLSEKEGKKYRLPTEAEWEYCCRAGKAGTRYSFGDEEAELGLYAWYRANSDGMTHPVGRKKANGWGLYDMHGNAWEWCQDHFDLNFYKTSPKQNPLGLTGGGERVFRGGSWDNFPLECSAPFRGHIEIGLRGNNIGFHNIGFRIVCELSRETITNSLGMKLVSIPPGKFTMGSPQKEIERCLVLPNEPGNVWWVTSLNSEGPEHEVEITQPFYMGATEVTVGQYRQFLEKEKFKAGPNDDYPVGNITQQNARDFCAWLSVKEGKTYRLPTEAEWEYCCRAGKSGTRYCFGNDDETLGQYAWFKENSGGKLHPVGKLKANDWGLFDMHGNAVEICQDGWIENYYKTSPQKDPQGMVGGLPVFRGGGYNGEAWSNRSAFRWRLDNVGIAAPGIGFRVILVHSPEKKGQALKEAFSLRFEGKESVELPPMPISATGPATFEMYVEVTQVSFPNGHALIELPSGRIGVGGGWGPLWLNVGPDVLKLGFGALKPGMNHVAGVRASDELRLFVNGTRVAALKTAPRSETKGTGLLGRDFFGLMREVRVSKSARYDKDFIPAKRFEPDADTLALYHFEEGQGNELKDSSGNGHHGKIVGAKWVKALGASASDFTNKLGMEFMRVPKGKSWLGGGKDKPGNQEVNITEDFYLGKYPVTQEEWEFVMKKNPSHFSRTGGGNGSVKNISDEDLKRFPVEQVSWNDAQEFLKLLNAMVKEEGWVYRLPGVLEWDYACRGGPMMDKAASAFDFYFQEPTNQLLPTQANFDMALGRTSKVGLYPPNRLGLFDMHGNVWQWCEDAGDPGQRYAMGGCWARDADCCRAGRRDRARQDSRESHVGLRLVRVPTGKELLKIAP